MIIHSREYFEKYHKEMTDLLVYVKKQTYGQDAVFLKEGIAKELLFIESIKPCCVNCLHRIGAYTVPGGLPVPGASCRVNGLFPENLDLGHYECPSWVWDDVPI